MTTIATRKLVKEAADNCGHSLDMWRNLKTPIRGFSFALRTSIGCAALWGLMALFVYTYATSGGN